MGSLYLAVPRASNIPVVVATGTAVKTVLQVATPSTTDIRVFAWGVSFAGIVATEAAGICTLMDTDVAATVTTVTPIEWESDDQVASLCVGGASATGYNASAEGTIGATTRDLDTQLVHPQTAYSIWFTPGRHPRVKASRFLRVRTTFAVTVNCLPFIIWEEPA
jgi:2-keto-3-deoxy-galactonokinase